MMLSGRQDNSFSDTVRTVFITAFTFRLVLAAFPAFSNPARLFRPDSWTYWYPAQAFVQSGHFYDTPGSGTFATLRPPGYELFLSGCFLISSGSAMIPSLLGVLFSALTVIPVMYCGKLLFGKRAGVIAGLLFAFNLTSLANSPLILADALLGFFCGWAAYFTVRAVKQHCVLSFAPACFLLGTASLVKPVASPLLLCGMPVLALFAFRFTKKTLLAWGCVLLSFLLLLMPWMLRNQSCGAGFCIDSNRGEMYYHSGSAILAHVNGDSSDAIRERMRSETEKFIADHPEQFPDTASKEAYKLHRYKQLIVEHPSAFLMTHMPQYSMLFPDLPVFLENFGVTSPGRGTLSVLREFGPVTALKHYLGGKYLPALGALPFVLIAGVLYVFAFLMLCLWLKKRHWKELFLFGAFGFYLLFAGGPVTMPRYQIPALPMLCAMAGGAMTLVIRKIQSHRRIQ